jgi:hypothetical protein
LNFSREWNSFCEWRAIVEAALAARVCARRVSTLYDETGHESMEDEIIVVAIEAELEEVPRGERRLLCEETQV